MCGVPCLNDLECQGADKCCQDDHCGKHCMPPQDLSLCRQQQEIAELLSVSERKGKGYIPQCHPDGSFVTKQCSRNGLVCWCVDPLGTKLKGSINSAAEVDCDRAAQNAMSRSLCDSTVCASTCDYGFRTDELGCGTCECDDPCNQMSCGDGEECVMTTEESCQEASCILHPQCRKIFIPPCAFGQHLTNAVTESAVTCEVDTKFGCPSGYHCVDSIPNSASYCCPDMVKANVSAELDADEGRLPSICEIMKDIAEGRRNSEPGHSLTIKKPRCTQQGEFEDVQCDNGECWCVDEFGVELASSRGVSDETDGACLQHRSDDSCPGLLCRLGCDYGFVTDPETHCPMCECRNPCDVTQCPAGQECQMAVSDCDEAPFCPALPYCVSSQRSREDVFLPELADIKSGQCPFLVPVSVDSCDNECVSDEHCDGSLKCCSNGCGTQCVEPLIKTACQHMQTIMKYKARESGVPANRLYIPRCRPEDGSYETIQCHPVTRTCWCVTSDGLEVAGTRVPPGLQPVCQNPRTCPESSCQLECSHGLELDTSGCPICKCHDPCNGVECRSEAEQCRLVQVNCIRAPCPLLPVCLPRLDNPCSNGQPLTDETNNSTVQCGPMGSTCPSTHKCHLSPLGEFSVCCPKPRDVCFQERNLGSCKNSVLRWSFNEKRNKCEALRFSGCGGNMNNFESEAHCNAVCPSLSGCEELREKNRKMADKYKKVVFNPKCHPVSGDWETIQCLEEVGICWCVDRDGEHIKGSLTRGKPVCGVRQSRQRSMDQPICPEGVTVHGCNKSMCDNKICLADPKAVCRVNPCGGCRHTFYDASGNVVDCEFGLSTCQRQVQSVLNSDVWALQGGPWNAQPLSVLSSSGQLPTSFSSDMSQFITEADAEALPPGLLTVASRSRRNVREEEEITTEISTNSMDESTEAMETIAGLDEFATIPEEQEGATDVAEMSYDEVTEVLDVTEQAPEMTSSRSAKFIDAGLLEEVDNSFDDSLSINSEFSDPDVELVTRTTQRPIPALRDAIKPGFCPPVRSRTFLRVLAQFAGGSACADQCISDADCAGATRCCPGECGSSCTLPVLLPTPLLPKPGACPPARHPFGCPSEVEGKTLSECSLDADCSGRNKCCHDGCSSTCSSPQEGSTGSLMLSLSPPVCTLKGEFAREQSHGEFSWCVDVNGRPIDESMTRGSVRCSPSGTILEQRALGPVCNDASVRPMVCRDQCLNARCPYHPDAICVTDPCDQCRVSFIDADGERLQCSDRCSHPPQVGHCRALFPRYFYNSTSQSCQQFMYGGCEGNENNFKSLEQCQNDCEKPVSVCELPKETGLCRAGFLRWHYNAATQQCEEFLFGGCGGNANNFHSLSQCMSRCPDLVVCPNMLPNGEMKSCSRDAACHGQTCTGFPDATCSVDPCTCTAIFRHTDGEQITCLPQPIIESRHAKIDWNSDKEKVPEDEEKTSTTTSTTTTTTSTTTTAPTTTPTTTTTTTTETSPSSAIPRGKSLLLEHHTRCQKMRQTDLFSGSEFVTECDHLGRFLPIQCLPAKTGLRGGRCWCVDEAGNRIANSTAFAYGEKTCRLVPVTAVGVTLGFPVIQAEEGSQMEVMKNQVRSQVSDILAALSARTMEPVLHIRNRQEGTILTFTLVGDNKIDVASNLEDMVKSGHLTLEMDGHDMPADVTSSKFYHKLDLDREVRFQDPVVQPAEETREILAQALDIEAPYLAIIVVLSALASILVCGLIIGLVLHRRRTTGMYPKGASTLASHPKGKKNKQDKLDVVPRGFPRVGISSSDIHGAQLSPTIPRSKRQTQNADAW